LQKNLAGAWARARGRRAVKPPLTVVNGMCSCWEFATVMCNCLAYYENIHDFSVGFSCGCKTIHEFSPKSIVFEELVHAMVLEIL